MNARELHRAATAVLAGDTTRYSAEGVANMALQMAEMVGWAPGVIDPRGELHEALDRLRSTARRQYAGCRHPGMAALHDALADLMDAVARHDLELRGDCSCQHELSADPTDRTAVPV